jgi:hypothetical protein
VIAEHLMQVLAKPGRSMDIALIRVASAIIEVLAAECHGRGSQPMVHLRMVVPARWAVAE